MFSNILLAVAGSEASVQAARKGIALASCLNAKVSVVAVTVPWAEYFARELAVVVPDVVVPRPEYDHKRNASAASILQGVETDARSAGVAVKSLHRMHRDPWQAILDVAKHDGCDLIVMGSHRKIGFTGALLGSETMTVLTHTSIPVLIYRQNEQ